MLIKGIFVNQNQLRAWLQNPASAPADHKENSLKAKVYNKSSAMTIKNLECSFMIPR